MKKSISFDIFRISNKNEFSLLGYKALYFTSGIWARSNRDAIGSLTDDPADRRRTHSQLERDSSLLAQVPENLDPETFEEASGHPDWDEAMNEEYHSLLENDTWDLVPL